MDCLDRTNVVQSTLAKRVLEKQLRVAGVLGPDETIDSTEFLPIFRNGTLLPRFVPTILLIMFP